MFASKNIWVHLLRGAVGFCAFAGAWFLKEAPFLATGLAVFGLLALRGCPMCWTVGLFETLSRRKNTRRCLSGNCSAQTKI